MSARPFSCSVPPESAINASLTGAYYYDCYAVAVPDTKRFALGYFLNSLRNTPLWVNSLMALRNKIVQLVGLKDIGGLNEFNAAKPESAYVPGDQVGIFTLLSNTHTEALLGIADKHLDVVLSVFKYPPNNEGIVLVTVTTVVHVHNFLGRLYMLPVTPLHKLIAPAVLSHAVEEPNAA
jgi:hypothetical protein